MAIIWWYRVSITRQFISGLMMARLILFISGLVMARSILFNVT